MKEARAASSLRVAIGHSVYDAGNTAALDAAVSAHNERERLPGLDDALNPTVIDPAKLTALLSAISPESLEALRGRPLFLDALRLGIAVGSPTHAAGFKAPLSLTLGEDHGGTIDATLELPVDCAAARRQAAAARTVAAAADREVRAGQGDVTPSRLRRYAAARVWAAAAAAASGCAPKDKAAAADRRTAEKAAQAAIILGGSME